ncbi:hypothetical protein F2Q69_00039067 [Brassica cretica]|uniref:Di19 C-terminal domain-containing protein n=1 Tax=Brassica cretica TaxID=69181 RepID=A0A8S9SPB4_BRACR|nr:hypothetical protein F2Q69_00039067 [Brassica cretica]
MDHDATCFEELLICFLFVFFSLSQVCPVCTKRVGLNIVGHITTQHANFFKISFPTFNVLILCSVVRNRLVYKLKSECVCFLDERFYVQRRRRLRKGGYGSAYLALKKELREANLQSLLGGSSRFTSSISIDSDPLLSSFMFSSPSSKSATPVVEGTSATKLSLKESHKRDIQEAPLSGEDQEKSKKSELVRGLLLSTMLGDGF